MKEDMREGDRQESLSGDAEGDSLSEGLGSEGTATLQETGEEAGLTAELESKNKEIQSLWDRLLRLQAEFENFKKRTARERTDLIKYANEGLLLEMIPVLDSLDRAIESAKANSNLENFLEGLGLVRRLLSILLAKAGV